MTVKELRYKLNLISDEDAEKMRVVVNLNEPSVGPIANTEVNSALEGFDWNRGLFILSTKDPVYRNKNDNETEEKQKYVRIIKDTEICRCPTCKVDVDRVDRYCKNCGQKFKEN